MSEINTSNWTPIGETSNSRYYEIEPHIIAAVPHQGSSDNGMTARENVQFQTEYLRRQGHGGVTLVFCDRMSGQDSEARRVYGSDADAHLLHGSALVSGTMLGRAIGSFFLGIARPQLPVEMFSSVEDAVVWARALNQAAAKNHTRENSL